MFQESLNAQICLKSCFQVYASPVSDWQVAFHKPDQQQLQPMNFTEARKQGYVFELMYGRILFRTPYGQPDSYRTDVLGHFTPSGGSLRLPLDTMAQN